ncbi:unnamed protein product [Prorocentrum cordatum]|uniref:Uncharacterized protein n=1 Tax=Prorocentrum cordatum TaxID=2364126 RepID=A0ABN9QB26_9DINO|nr:unnamed protein product [Polarella glacialis]
MSNMMLTPAGASLAGCSSARTAIPDGRASMITKAIPTLSAAKRMSNMVKASCFTSAVAAVWAGIAWRITAARATVINAADAPREVCSKPKAIPEWSSPPIRRMSDT